MLYNFNCTIDGCTKESGFCPSTGGNCTCFVEYSGPNCSLTLKDTFGKSFLAYQYLYGTLYPIIIVSALFILYKVPKKQIFHYGIFSSIIYCSIARTIFLWVDPHGVNRIPRVLSQIIYGTGIWSLFSLLLLIVILWIYIFKASLLRQSRMKKYIVIAVSGFVFYFFFHLATDILRTYFNFGKTRLYILIAYFVVSIIVIVLPAIVYLIYGRRLYRELSNISSPYLTKITFLTTSVTIFALALICTFIAVLIVAMINDTQTLFLVSHYIYRSLEILYMTFIICAFYFSFGWKTSKNATSISYRKLLDSDNENNNDT